MTRDVELNTDSPPPPQSDGSTLRPYPLPPHYPSDYHYNYCYNYCYGGNTEALPVIIMISAL